MVGLKQFDRKFGADLVRELPAEPAVYLFKDEDGAVIYAGKAKNIRRRLQSYRGASRRKVHRKMRTLVREASALEVRLQPSEEQALLVENELIRTLRPYYNVDGAFSFLYPALGLGVSGHQTLLCFTTRVDAFQGLGLRFFGCFRSRHRTLDAYEALCSLLGQAGHREPRSRLPELPQQRGSRCAGFRRAEAWEPSLRRLLAGESSSVLPALATELVERAAARRNAEQVGEDLRLLQSFFDSDAAPLREALRCAGRQGHYIDQEERDSLFISHRHRSTEDATR